MSEFIEKYNRLIFIGSFISVLALIAIIINKYWGTGKQGFELNIVLYSLSVFAVVTPFVFNILKMVQLKSFLAGIILLLLLSVELFLWVILFHGFKALPDSGEFVHFFIPPGLYIVSAFLVMIFSSQNTIGPE
jgi:hypothetical protein